MDPKPKVTFYDVPSTSSLLVDLIPPLSGTSVTSSMMASQPTWTPSADQPVGTVSVQPQTANTFSAQPCVAEISATSGTVVSASTYASTYLPVLTKPVRDIPIITASTPVSVPVLYNTPVGTFQPAEILAFASMCAPIRVPALDPQPVPVGTPAPQRMLVSAAALPSSSCTCCYIRSYYCTRCYTICRVNNVGHCSC